MINSSSSVEDLQHITKKDVEEAEWIFYSSYVEFWQPFVFSPVE